VFYSYLIQSMGVSPRAAHLVADAEAAVTHAYHHADEIAAYNHANVLHAMQRCRVSEADFHYSSGYGYNDAGRDRLEAVFAEYFHAEAALVRPQIISGTHALACALFGCLRPGDTLVSVTGRPYDTLHAVIGTTPAVGSLMEWGVQYRECETEPDGTPSAEELNKKITPATRMALIQRSKGYAFRPSLTVRQIKKIIADLKRKNPHIICLVDNCYGEFVEETEPIHAGADLCAGSLTKNPGGGLAPCGGYVVGNKNYVHAAASRLSAPGIGGLAGPSLYLAKDYLQGFFLSPQVVGNAVKGAALAAEVFSRLGYVVCPGQADARACIVQAIKLGSEKKALAFCAGVQRAAPVDAFVTPVAAPMPGYAHPVVMAAGAFITGSSIELSADGPLREPYAVYMQGGITWPHAKVGIAFAADAVGEFNHRA
jgi:cystathionine beta-lyase family protein involved in aluminum resistance